LQLQQRFKLSELKRDSEKRLAIGSSSGGGERDGGLRERERSQWGFKAPIFLQGRSLSEELELAAEGEGGALAARLDLGARGAVGGVSGAQSRGSLLCSLGELSGVVCACRAAAGTSWEKRQLLPRLQRLPLALVKNLQIVGGSISGSTSSAVRLFWALRLATWMLILHCASAAWVLRIAR
jgi:hypothetical protein